MGRVRPPNPAGGLDADEDIRALMADIDASMADLEQRLEESRRSAESRGRKPLRSEPEPAAELPVAPSGPAPAEAAPPAPEHHESSLLAELAQEAADKLGTGRSADEDRQARDRLIHESLERIFQFLNQFSRHANNIAPQINRPYRLDTRTSFADLTWRGAFADFRKQDLSEKSRLAHVGFRVRLVAPAPITITRRWDQMDALRKEMHILDLRTVEGHEPIGSPQQEHIEVRLAPDFPIHIRFRGNYDAGRIDVLARNIEGFGIAAFELDPQDVSQTLLDGIGRFLLFRTDKLPAALRRVQFFREPSE